MLKINIKYLGIVCILFFTIMLTSCKKVSEVSSDNEMLSKLTESENALLMENDNKKEDEEITGLKQVVKGNLEVETTARVTLYYPEKEQIIYPEDKITASLIEIFVAVDDVVDKGDKVASVEYNIDKIELERLKLNLKRKEETFKEEKEEKNSQLNDAKKLIELASTKEEKQDKKDIYNTLKLEYDTYKDMKEDELNLIREETLNYESKTKIGYILAPSDGKVSEIASIKMGDILYPNQVIGSIDNLDNVYFSILNESGEFRYNMEVDLVVTNEDDTKDSKVEYYKGVIISGSNLVSGPLKQNIAFIQLLDGDINDLQKKTIKAIGKTKYMSDVLLVDKTAVEFDKKIPYVMEYKGGKIYKKNFVMGGLDSFHYLIYKGLEEGMEVKVVNKKK